jgi:hypothetical protein
MSLAESILWIPPIDPYNWSDRLGEPLLEVFPPAVSQEFPRRMMEGKPIERVPRRAGWRVWV